MCSCQTTWMDLWSSFTGPTTGLHSDAGMTRNRSGSLWHERDVYRLHHEIRADQGNPIGDGAPIAKIVDDPSGRGIRAGILSQPRLAPHQRGSGRASRGHAEGQDRGVGEAGREAEGDDV